MNCEKYSIPVREAYKTLRKQIIEGAPAGGRDQRIRLLAFTFIRGRAYETVEQTTEAKNYEYVGKLTYYGGLAYSISHKLAEFIGADVPAAGREQLRQNLSAELMQWMKSHWEKKEEPVVAAPLQEVAQ
jgi:hypothetical protein